MKMVIDEYYHRSLKSNAIPFYFVAKILGIEASFYKKKKKLLKGNQAKKFDKLFIKSK